MSSSSRLLAFQLLLFSFWLRHLWSFISCRFLMHTTACLVVTPNAKSWVVKSTRLEFIDFIGSNSNWLTEHTEPVDWETRLFQSFLTSTWRLWLFVVAIGLTWDFVISWSKTSARMSCNIPFQNIPDSRRKPLKILVLYIIYIWSYKQIFAKIARSEHTWNLCTDPQRLFSFQQSLVLSLAWASYFSDVP